MAIVDIQVMCERLLCGWKLFFVDRNYSLTKVVFWSGTCGWHEKCGRGHNYIHVIKKFNKQNTSCIIDWTNIWVMCDMQLKNNNLYCKVKKRKQKMLHIGQQKRSLYANLYI